MPDFFVKSPKIVFQPSSLFARTESFRDMNDLMLIERIKRRDQEAMVALHARYANLVYSIAFRVLDDDLTAQECVQDSFMKVWQSTTHFDPQREPFIGWLVGIARNMAIDELRRRGRQVAIATAFSNDERDDECMFGLSADWQQHEQVNSLRLAVSALPFEQRQVIELSYYGGMSQSDIAEILALPLGTVKTRMSLGMQKLRDAWLPDDDSIIIDRR